MGRRDDRTATQLIVGQAEFADALVLTGPEDVRVGAVLDRLTPPPHSRSQHTGRGPEARCSCRKPVNRSTIRASASATVRSTTSHTVRMSWIRFWARPAYADDDLRQCTSQINGRAVNPCAIPVKDLGPTDEVTTIEGLADTVDADLHPVQQAWLDLDVAQCGYCNRARSRPPSPWSAAPPRKAGQ